MEEAADGGDIRSEGFPRRKNVLDGSVRNLPGKPGRNGSEEAGENFCPSLGGDYFNLLS